MSIRTLFSALIALVAIVGLLGVGVVGYLGWSTTVQNKSIITGTLDAVNAASLAKRNLVTAKQLADDVLKMTQLREPTSYLNEYDEALATVESALISIGEQQAVSDMDVDLDKLLQDLRAWRDAKRLAISGEETQAITTQHVLATNGQNLLERMANLETSVFEKSIAWANATQEDLRVNMMIAGTVLIFILAGATIFAFLYINRSTNLIVSTISVMQHLARGDLTAATAKTKNA